MLKSILTLSLVFVCTSAETNPSASSATWSRPGACGANSLYALLSLENKPVELKSLMASLSPDPFLGSNMEELSREATLHGMKTRLLSVPPSEFPALKTPYIAHLQTLNSGGTGHFITVYDYVKDPEGDVLYYFDGTTCLATKKRLELLKSQLSGAVLLPETVARGGLFDYAACILIVVLFAAVFSWFYPKKDRQTL